jgi:hypothetical protein
VVIRLRFPQRDQPLLLPADMRGWLPEDDLAFVVLDAVATPGTSHQMPVSGRPITRRCPGETGTNTQARNP